MKRFSTQCMNEINKTKKSRSAGKSSPKKKTMDFLTQFARAYHAEPDVRQELCGYVMN